MNKFFIILIFLFVSGYGICQHRIGDFLAYGHNNGLPVSLYYTVFQSSDGYLWTGSSTGLVRFDGKRYKIFFSDYTDANSLSDNIINDIVEDDEGHLWIAGLFQGLTKYDLHTGHIRRYSRLSQDKTNGYGINRLLKDDKGDLWITTAGRGLARYLPERDSFEFFIPDPSRPSDGSDRNSNYVSGIAVDKSDPDIFWLSCFDGLYSFNRKQKTFQHFINKNPIDIHRSNALLCIETDRTDKIWLGTWYVGMTSFDKRTHQFETYSYPEALADNNSHYVVLDIKSINDSTLYLASRNDGLLSFNKNTNEIHSIINQDQLPDGSSGIDIQRISLTPDAGIFAGGNYYIYQQHPSFNRFGQSLIFDLGSDFGVDQVVYDPYREGYWMSCTYCGVVIFAFHDMTRYEYFKSENETHLHFADVAVDHMQRVWAVSNAEGLLVLNKNDQKFHQVDDVSGLHDNAHQIVSVESDRDGNLWFTTRKKLFHVDVSTNIIREWILQQDNEVALTNITLCSGLNHDAWVSSDNGLFHFINAQNKVIHLVPDEESKKSIANLFIKTMTVDHAGNAWLGFESDGIQVLSANDHHVLETYNLSNGLPGMQINQMATDSAGRIWVGTSAGLALFNPHPDMRVWQLFNREDGIKRDYIDRTIMTTVDGKLFFNIEKGVSWIDIEDDATLKSRNPILHLTSLTVDGKPYTTDLAPDYVTMVDLPYSSREINIEYAAMDWLHPSRTKYFYHIEGISPEGAWIENEQASILLTGMKPGDYMLRLYAINGDGLRSNEIKLPMIMHFPFWQHWWFIILCSLTVLAIGYAIYRYRIGQINKLQLMRNTISTNLHDDIGASLSNIHILNVLTQRHISNKENATSYITKAGDEIQRISEALSDIVWNINPKYDDLDNLFIRMKRYAADMLDGKNIQAQLMFPEENEKLTMPMDQRRDFYLIFKEAVNNLVKYSEATEAKVVVEIGNKYIRLIVNDNGIGYLENDIRPGNGIQNMKQRAEKWKSVLQIKSKPEEGTRIELEMKVN
ncbi:MAG TPA: two-component regulator propeller domain-containing protein [Saprospiraceae bacterium]|nr:two-component regulator propeller domain-containing protein [Saprospiraceae bacterium]